MGVVYMAEQEEPVRRRVALKIIKLGMDTRQVVARFEAERQALALMDHPNIARVLDGGATETGRPYFVMELVQGVPITEFCDKNKLSAQERLKLFIQVCQAIQSAHQKAIIHRDIKPSNVLVTLHHGEPMPKVIDFGIAKATSQKLTEKTLFTNYGTMIGTPAYMSPEQAEMSSLDVDTRADVYSLGVLLYELLTSTTPFSERRLRSLAYGEMQRVIMEEEPERPSTRLSTMSQAEKTVVVKNTGQELVSLRHLLKGDLDWIVMKCLEKDRRRRYETANGLTADIQRHLTNEPVVARPPGTCYRLQKLAKRNSVAFGAAIVVALSLTVGFIVATWQAIRARRAEASAQYQVIRANEAQKVALEKSAIAEQERNIAESSLYAADMNLVQQDLAAGNLGLASDLLDRHRPRAGQKDLRGWEWRYLWARCRSDEEFTLGTHQERVTGVAFSPDGRIVATADVPDSDEVTASKVLLWDFPSRKLLSPPISEDSAGSVAFSPDGKLIAFGTLHNEIVVLHVATRAKIATFPGRQRQSRNNGLAFSPDGKLLAIGGLMDSIKLFEVEGGRERLSLVGHREDVTSLAFFPDGTKLISGSWDNSAKLWDLSSGQVIRTWSNYTDAVQGVAVSPGGKIVACASWDETLHLSDPRTGEEIAAIISKTVGWASSVAFSSDGRTFACGGSDHSLRIWDTNATEIRRFRGSRDEVLAVAYSPDGQSLVSGTKDGTVKVWAVAPKSPEISFRTNSAFWKTSTLSSDGRWLLEVMTNDSYSVIEIPSLREIVHRALPELATKALGFSIATDGVKLAYRTQSQVCILNAVTGEPIKEFVHLGTNVSGSMFSPNGQILAINDTSNLTLWDVNSWTKLKSFRHVGANYYGIVLSEDAKQVAAGGADGKVEVWRDDQREPQVWKAHKG
jgi:eukaryotic-like serine/threonine-protein kinase